MLPTVFSRLKAGRESAMQKKREQKEHLPFHKDTSGKAVFFFRFDYSKKIRIFQESMAQKNILRTDG